MIAVLAIILSACPIYAFMYGNILESIIVAVAYFQCFMGLWLFHSARKTSNVKLAETKIFLGIFLFGLGCLFLQLMLKWRLDG